MSTHQVTLDTRGLSFDASERSSLLHSAERAGVRLPSGCRSGACLNCAAHLVAGHVAMPPGTALTAEHLEQRVVLPCVARPRSDLVLRTGRAMGVLDVPPWTD